MNVEHKLLKVKLKSWIEIDADWASHGTFSTTIGCLFDDKFVKLHTSSIGMGGSWDKKAVADQIEIKFLYEKLREFDSPIMMDAGANTGSFCLLPTVIPDLKCCAFEPIPWIFDLLKINVKLNELEQKVAVFPFALADKNGIATLKCPAECTNKGVTINNSGLSCIGTPLRFETWVELEVPTRTLDDIISKNNIKHVDIIKIDVEGGELFVLKGAEKLIKEQHPGILVDVTDNTNQFSYDKFDIPRLLESWGYENKTEVVKDAFYFWS